mmetsp:Transcript_76093/g.211555  ORF Transcript_76093/g.211555 Transcript_76093/m.211555 type:complete len:244 (-) Transcript_76093:99-830(-)
MGLSMNAASASMGAACGSDPECRRKPSAQRAGTCPSEPVGGTLGGRSACLRACAAPARVGPDDSARKGPPEVEACDDAIEIAFTGCLRACVLLARMYPGDSATKGPPDAEARDEAASTAGVCIADIKRLELRCTCASRAAIRRSRTFGARFPGATVSPPALAFPFSCPVARFVPRFVSSAPETTEEPAPPKPAAAIAGLSRLSGSTASREDLLSPRRVLARPQVSSSPGDASWQQLQSPSVHC